MTAPSANPRLVVVDLDKLPRDVAYDLETVWYAAILPSSDLTHLAACARSAEERREQAWLEFAFGERVS